MNRGGGRQDIMADKRTMTLNLTDEEMNAVEALSTRYDMTKTAIIRKALRMYIVIDARLQRGEKLFMEDEIEKNLSYLINHQHKNLTLVVHPIMHAYLTKGWIFGSRQWKWRWKFKQATRILSNTNYHLTEFKFFDKHEDEIKL